MRKRTILLLLALMSALNCFASYVYDTVYVSTIRYRILSESDRTVEVAPPPSIVYAQDTMRIFEYRGDVVIPSTTFLDSIEYRVIRIGDQAFCRCEKLTSISIPESVTDIGELAFLECTGLKTISIAEGVTNIGYLSFYGCSELTSITIPESVISIGNSAFCGCSKVSTLIIPKGVTNIAYAAFFKCDLDTIKVAPENTVYDSRGDCNALIETNSSTLMIGCKNTVIPEDVTTIGDCAFYGCFSISSMTIPPSVTTIGNWAFGFCYGLTSIVIPENVDSIGANIVVECSNLSSITVDENNRYYNSYGHCNAIIDNSGNLIAGCDSTVIPSGVVNIDNSAFYGCGITTMVIPESVTRISSEAFRNCIELTTVELPSGLTYIGSNAFRDCRNITSIIIPKNISIIDEYAFAGCSGLRSLTFLGDTLPDMYRYGYAFNGVGFDSCTLYVPDGRYLYYSQHFSHRNFKSIQILKNPDCITIDGINYCIVSSYDKTVRVVHGDYIGDVVIPSSVKNDGADYSVVSISNEAFALCNKMTSIVLNEGVKDIGEYAFYQCGGMLSASLPTSVQTIGHDAFSGCALLESFVVPQGVKTIEYRLFEGCTALKTIELHSNIDSICFNAFSGCSTLKNINIPLGIDYIGDGAFNGCKSLEYLNIPDGAKVSGFSTFKGCELLTSISIPSSDDYYFSNTFSGCKSLKSIIIPEGVKAIYDNTFSGCHSLSYLSLPASVQTFGKNVFDDCYGLNSAGPQGGGYNYEFSWSDSIPGNAFNGMRSLKSLYIPKSIKYITDQGLVYDYITVIDDYGTTRSFYKAKYFEGCDSLESLAISFSDTKIRRGISDYSRYRYQDYVDYILFIGTPIHSITYLDDTIRANNSFIYGKVDEITVSEFVKDINPGFFNGRKSLKRIDVDKGNSNYSSVEGVLFDKNGLRLLVYPSAKESCNYTVPDGVASIEDFAFLRNTNLSSVTISGDVRTIGEGAFESCHSLVSVKILGSPTINQGAFSNCQNIETVRSWSTKPGKMMLCDTPRTINVGPDKADNRVLIEESYNHGLERSVYKISCPEVYDWTFDIISTGIPAGQYKVSMGILPNESDPKLNRIHPIIKGITDSIDMVLLDSIVIDTIELHGRIRYVSSPQYLFNDTSGYDCVPITNVLAVPEGLKGIKITLSSVGFYSDYFTPVMWLDRVFFEPLDQDQPEERYAGPFAESVFNNATLLVPESAVNAYKSAKGWKMFKNILVDTTGLPEFKDNNNKPITDAVIYDLLGRRVNADSLEALPPGLYTVNGRKYLVK